MFCGIWCPGGRGEIRTLGTRLDTPPFQGGTLNHSATLPVGLRLLDPEPGYLGNQKGVSANEEIAHSTDFNFFRKGCATVFGGEKPLCFATIDRGFRRFRSEPTIGEWEVSIGAGDRQSQDF